MHQLARPEEPLRDNVIRISLQGHQYASLPCAAWLCPGTHLCNQATSRGRAQRAIDRLAMFSSPLRDLFGMQEERTTVGEATPRLNRIHFLLSYWNACFP